MKKLLFVLALIGFLIAISCSNVYFPQSLGYGVKKGTGGGQTVGLNYLLPEGSLSQLEQNKPYDPNENTITLFKKGDFGSKFFRIPALIVTKKGTILAATDRRYNKTQDLGKTSKIDVILRRSTDLGSTWSKPITVGPGSKDDSGSDSYGDAFFINCHNGDIILGVIENPGIQRNNQGKTVLYRSTDDGLSWTKSYEFMPTQVNNANKGFGASGQGLTLRHGKNSSQKRLIFAYFQWDKRGDLSVTTIFSDNDGISWNTSYGNTGTMQSIDETKIYEMSDGSILLNHRTILGARAWSKSTDLGKSWVYTRVKDDEVIDPGCNADLVRYEFNGKHIKENKYALLINCHMSVVGYFPNRKNHYIFMTKNEFQNGTASLTGKYHYDKQLVIGGENLYSGYPTISVLPDGTIITLTEETPDNAPAGLTDTYDIVFRRFNLYWLTDGKESVDYSKDYLFQQPQN
ncbi:exo-alpha-sialidase [uncultured Brachyspira sp.]|uniref:sialidase family protein n=1 Tax=uncultured Brachyspira sp. TaxID=221953 RepID=UPI0025E8F1CF|nr:sialidase family protein [uncultured Brachyspira sp.]